MHVFRGAVVSDIATYLPRLCPSSHDPEVQYNHWFNQLRQNRQSVLLSITETHKGGLAATGKYSSNWKEPSLALTLFSVEIISMPPSLICSLRGRKECKRGMVSYFSPFLIALCGRGLITATSSAKANPGERSG